MDPYETIWVKQEETDETPNETGTVTGKNAALDHYETIWIKQETDEAPNEVGSAVQSHPSSAHVKGELEEDLNQESVDPLRVPGSEDIIKEVPEVILQVDETENIVAASTRCESDRTQVINRMSISNKTKWDEETMKKAVDYVLSGRVSIREAAGQFSVPKSSLGERVAALKRGESPKMEPSRGRFKNTFSGDLEDELIKHLRYLDNCFLPVNKTEFLKLVFDLAEDLKLQHQFNKNKKSAGNKFFRGFMKRHPEFSLRCAQSTSLQRAQGFNTEQVGAFYGKLEELMDRFSFPPNRIYNCDETGISIVHSNTRKVLSIKGKKQVSKLTSGERGRNITIMLCINAAGDNFIPPLFVFPRIRMDPQLMKDAPDGSVFEPQESGWISVSGFLKWMTSFVEKVRPTKENPVLLILDGHSTHKDLEVVLFAKKHNIHMLSLPPHTTHKLQPLDRTVIKPFKSAFNAECELWMSKYGRLGLKITDRDICGLVAPAFSKICRMELAKAGFQCTGIYPLNKNIFTDLDFLPSLNNRTVAERDTSAADESDQLSTATQLVHISTVQKLQEPINLAVPSTSKDFQNAIQKISPMTDDLERKIVTRRMRGERSEILTSTPFKRQLEEKEERKHLKKQKQEAGSTAVRKNEGSQKLPK